MPAHASASKHYYNLNSANSANAMDAAVSTRPGQLPGALQQQLLGLQLLGVCCKVDDGI